MIATEYSNMSDSSNISMNGEEFSSMAAESGSPIEIGGDKQSNIHSSSVIFQATSSSSSSKSQSFESVDTVRHAASIIRSLRSSSSSMRYVREFKFNK